MESFFGTLKTELVHQREYPDRDAARRDLFAYIEAYYNRRPIHSAIGYLTPEQAHRKTAQPGIHSSGGRSRLGGAELRVDFDGPPRLNRIYPVEPHTAAVRRPLARLRERD